MNMKLLSVGMACLLGVFRTRYKQCAAAYVQASSVTKHVLTELMKVVHYIVDIETSTYPRLNIHEYIAQYIYTV